MTVLKNRKREKPPKKQIKNTKKAFQKEKGKRAKVSKSHIAKHKEKAAMSLEEMKLTIEPLFAM